MFEFYLLIVLFPLYFSETIIPVSNFQNVTIPFETEYCDYILKYSITGYTSFQYTKLVIRKFEIINFYLMDYHYMYLYDNLDTLLEDKKNKAFSNNIYKKRFNGYDQIFEIDVFNNHEDKTYYLAFEKNHYQFYKYNGTFLIYSTIANLTITQPISFTGKTANYLFYISSQHEKKYSHFGFRRMINDVLGKIEIFDGQSYKLLYQNDSKDYIEDYFELQMKYCYYISLTLTSNSQNNGDINKIYFYLLQTDYNDLIINLQQSSDFKEFPVLKELNLLLKLNVGRFHKVYIEYNWEYSLEDSIKVYGYSDKNLINNTLGKKIDLIKDDECIKEKRICEDFIRIKEKDLNYVVLKISSLKKNYNDSYLIKIKYGRSEEYAPDNFLFSSLMGLGLCVPNILLFILNVNKCKRKSLTYGFLVLDIIFFLGFSNLISLYIYIGRDQSYYLGIVLLSLYGLAFILFYLYQIKGKTDETSSGFVYFLKLLSFPTIEQTINESKKLQPCLKIKARSFHQESREVCDTYENADIYGRAQYYYEQEEGSNDLVLKERLHFLRTQEMHTDTIYSDWGRVDQGGGKFIKKFESNDKCRYEITKEEKEVETWNKEEELKYTSWEDNTNFISNFYEPVLGVNFKTEFILNDDTKNDIENLKTQMNEEAKTHDTETEISEIFTVTRLKEKVACLPKDNFMINLIYLFIAFIFTIFGFSSFVNFFIFYEEKEVDITLIKSVASTNKYNNPYVEQTLVEDSINISDQKGNNTKAGQIYEPLIA